MMSCPSVRPSVCLSVTSVCLRGSKFSFGRCRSWRVVTCCEICMFKFVFLACDVAARFVTAVMWTCGPSVRPDVFRHCFTAPLTRTSNTLPTSSFNSQLLLAATAAAHYDYASVVIGRITGLARPSVRPVRAPNSKTKLKSVFTSSGAGVIIVLPIFRVKD